MLKAKNHKKLFSLMMSLAMVFSCITAGTMNVRAERLNQITFGGQEVDPETDATHGHDDHNEHEGKIKINKTIQEVLDEKGTPIENLFDITLSVQTQEKAEKKEYDPSLATVLVLDISSSMNDPLTNNQTRLAAMKEAVLNFIDSYKNYNGEVAPERLLQIITFDKNAYQRFDWTNVAGVESTKEVDTLVVTNYDRNNNPSEYEIKPLSIENFVNGTYKDGKKDVSYLRADIPGTNIDAGLKLAEKNISELITENPTKYSKNNVNVILLTDGSPNYYAKETYENNEFWYSTGSLGGTATDAYFESWSKVGGNIPDKDLSEEDNKGTSSFEVRQNSKLYSIAFATSDKCKFYHENPRGGNSGKYNEINPITWLSTFSDEAYHASNSEQLENVFASISHSITSKVDAWVVTDPMGDNIILDQEKLVQDYGQPAEEDAIIKSLNKNEFKWNLDASNPVKTETNSDGTLTTYTYELTYRVALDTTNEGFVFNQSTPSNKETTLTYDITLTKDNVVTGYHEGLGYFNLPTVQGFKGSFEFDKVDENNQPLAGATFKLEGVATGSGIELKGDKALTATSTIQEENGEESAKVKFDNIPAGQYILSEESAPNGYEKSNKTWFVIVSYGETKIYDRLRNEITNFDKVPNEQKKVKVQLTAKKELFAGNADSGIKLPLEGHDFAFVLIDKNNNNEINGILNSATGVVTFPEFNLPVGEYEYTIKENSENPQNGVTYDTLHKDIVINVTENIDGTLVATVTSDNVEVNDGVVATFENVYNPESVELTIKGHKTLDGRPLKDKEFTFNVTNVNDKNNPKSIVATGKNDANGNINFSKINYDILNLEQAVKDNLATKTVENGNTIYSFDYSVEEDIENLNKVGITPKNYQFNIRVNVIDNGNGILTTNVVYPDGGLKFVNTYSMTKPDSLTISGTKLFDENGIKSSVLCKDLKDKFTFSIRADKDAPLPEIKEGIKFDDAGNINFGEIEFDTPSKFDGINAAGLRYIVYTYTVEEQGDVSGVRNDQPQTFTVTLTDDGKGNLSVVTDPEQTPLFTFENTYAVKGELNLGATKELEGRNMKAGEFTFTISSNDENAPLPANVTAVNDANGNIKFDKIEFNKVGSYTYFVQEEHAGETIDGVTYDDKVYTVKVVVSDTDKTDGKLDKPVYTIYNDKNNQVSNIKFKNSYTTNSKSLNVKGKKILNKADGLNLDYEDILDCFTFTISGNKDAPLPISNLNNVKFDVDGNIDFGTINFTLPSNDDFEKYGETHKDGSRSIKYTYTINESGEFNGVENGDAPTFEVTLTDDGKGNLKIDKGLVDDVLFKYFNTYTPTKTTSSLTVHKALNGRDLHEKEFEFVMTENEKVIATVENKKDGTIIFDDIEFTNAGTRQFIIKEVNGGQTTSGVKYDDKEIEVIAEVTDDVKTGELTVRWYVDGKEINPDTNDMKFVNTYNATGSVALVGHKILNGRPLKTNEFTFNVATADKEVVATGTNDANGNVNFSSINYTTSGLKEAVEKGNAIKTKVNGKDAYTFLYTVDEVTTDLEKNGITSTQGHFVIVVQVLDNENGHYTTTTYYPNNGNNLEFVNTYKTNEVPFAIIGNKELSLADKELSTTIKDIEGKFTFTISSDDEKAPLPIDKTATNDVAGNINFGEIMFKNPFTKEDKFNADGTRSKVYTYKVTETGNAEGITNDVENTKEFKVKVTDDGKGNLTVTRVNEDGSMFTFINNYDVKDISESVTDHIDLNKKLTGREMKAGEFEFVMVNAEGTVVASGTNKADGTVDMSSITFTKAGIFNFTVYEVNSGKTMNGVTFDEKVYNVVATVTDNTKGELKVEWTLSGGEDIVVFTNTYKANPAIIDLLAKKVLNNRELLENEFTFALMDANGEIVSTARNDKEGNISFKELSFDKVGTYGFMLSEVQGNDKDIEYDLTVYQVVIVVTDDGNGKLVANVTPTTNELVFTNTYIEPDEVLPDIEPPVDPVPPVEDDVLGDEKDPVYTGDNSQTTLFGMLGMLSLAGIVLLRKKEEETK